MQRFRGAEQLERFSRGGGSCAVDFCAVRCQGQRFSRGFSRGGAEVQMQEQRWSRGGGAEKVQSSGRVGAQEDGKKVSVLVIKNVLV